MTERGDHVETRKVTIQIGGKPCSFLSDDPDEYISALEQRANVAMKLTEGFSGSSAYTNAVLSVISLTDQLMRTEQKIREAAAGPEPEAEESRRAAARKKSAVKAEENPGQISVWDVLGNGSAETGKKND